MSQGAPIQKPSLTPNQSYQQAKASIRPAIVNKSAGTKSGALLSTDLTHKRMAMMIKSTLLMQKQQLEQPHPAPNAETQGKQQRWTPQQAHGLGTRRMLAKQQPIVSSVAFGEFEGRQRLSQSIRKDVKEVIQGLVERKVRQTLAIGFKMLKKHMLYIFSKKK